MAQKYIIGDIVMYKNRIHTIIDISASNGYELSYVRHPVSPVRLSGVPLTPEILEKNGWKKSLRPYSKYSWYRRKGYPTLNIRSENEILFYWGDHNENITTVHKLQHLLFGLNINSEMEV